MGDNQSAPQVPARLYKYMRGGNDGVLRFFNSGMLRFTQPVEFNDPFEMQPFVKGLADEPTIENQFREQFDSTLEAEMAKALAGLMPQQRELVDSVMNQDSLRQVIQQQSPQALGL